MNTQLKELGYSEIVAINGGFNDPDTPAGKAGAALHRAWKALVHEIREAIETFREGWDSVEDI